MRIAVDVMGGDFAPGQIIEGVADAIRDFPNIQICLVGHVDKIMYYMEKFNLENHPRIDIKHAEQVVYMGEKSTVALRSKKKSSISVAADLLKQKEVDAIVSAGHTGAAVATTTVKVRTLKGVDRPAIVTPIPAKNGHFVLVDAGANPDCKPHNLAQFAIMGDVYSRFMFDIKNPKIGLLSVGGEEGKGNELTKESYNLLADMPINFIGNVEGKDIFQNSADVVVCDGFVGNVVLKSCEGFAKATMHWLKEAFTQNTLRKTGAMLAKNAFKDLASIADDEEFGGAPLLGINGICIIGHGSSSAKSIRNAIKVAKQFIEAGINDQIEEGIKNSNIDINLN